MRIAFMGTPEFALPSLKMLLDAGHTLTVFTQPDRPVGRKGLLTPPPVKRMAEENGIPVLQFARIRDEEGVAALKAFAPELTVTAAFGQILSAEILGIAPLGCINVHGSLLPAYRGSAPIQWAIANGETVTGVTTMMTDTGIDTGDVLLKKEVPILREDTTETLTEKLSLAGAELLSETLRALENGTLTRTPQDDAAATRCPLIRKEHGHLNPSGSAVSVHNLVRAFNPWPGVYGLLPDGSALRLWETALTDRPAEAAPGTLLGDGKNGLFLCCGDDVLEVLSVQGAGGKRMEGRAYLRGKPLAGTILQ